MEIQLNLRTLNGIPVLDIGGELDLYTSPKLRAVIEDLLLAGHTRLMVNLLETTYLDSTGLAILARALKQVRDVGGDLGLIYNQPQIERMFTITGLHEIFPIFGSEREASAAASAWGSAPDQPAMSPSTS